MCIRDSNGRDKDNPCRTIRSVPQTVLSPRSLNRRDQQRFIASIKKYGNQRDYAIAALILHTGLRVSELCSLEVGDITIRPRSGDIEIHSRHSKGSKYRKIPLNATIRRVLSDYLSSHSPDLFLFFSAFELLPLSLRLEAVSYTHLDVYKRQTMHSRAGAQVPFSSLNFGTDITPEGRNITKAVLEAFYAGLGRGESPIFPNLVFRLKKGINLDPGDPNHDLFQLAVKVASRRLNPTFSFMDASINRKYGDEVSYMGCRSRVIANRHGPEISAGRGNIAPVTINLPRLSIEALSLIHIYSNCKDKDILTTIDKAY